MWRQSVIVSSLLILGGCDLWAQPRHYSIYFEPYSADPGTVARGTIHAAADFARAHPSMPVSVMGYAAQTDPKRNVDGLPAQRAAVVSQILAIEGVSPGRVTTQAAGIIDPNELPSLAVRRVDIAVGVSPTQ